MAVNEAERQARIQADRKYGAMGGIWNNVPGVSQAMGGSTLILARIISVALAKLFKRC